MSGYLYEFRGRVVAGDKRGATIGFPTANIIPPAGQAPEPGVYSALADGRPAAVNVGTRPTFAGATPGRVVEVHILDFNDDLYGRCLHVQLIARLRGEQQFISADELVIALEHDIAAVRASVQTNRADQA